MFGLNGEFDYGECEACGSIQIMRVPGNLSDYYPDNYCSFRPRAPGRRTLRRWFVQQRQEHANGHVNHLGRLLAALFGEPLTTGVDWIRISGIRFEDRVLDVGCGSGAMLAGMREKGFRNLTGVDPYMKTETKVEGFALLRKEMNDLDGVFDVIMLHHSFEHMPHPMEALMDVNRLLAPTGIALVRTPVAGSYAWRTYNAHWFQLDAPRHLFIPSRKGLSILAQRAGFVVETTVFDSTPSQFMISEKYARGIAFSEPDNRRFSRREARSYADRARALNASQDGDQAGFLLRKASVKSRV